MSARKAVIFDLDGTLIDSAPDLHAAVNVALAELGRPALSLAQVTSFVGNGVAKLVERSLEATGGGGADLRADALARFHNAYAVAPAALTRPYPGARAALAALAGAGFALGLCTNKPEAPARAILESLGLADVFETVIGGDTLAVLKPDPAPLRAAVARLGAGAAFYVGDSETDEATARNAGVPFFFFTGGYRKKAAEDFTAAFVFSDFAALPPRLIEG